MNYQSPIEVIQTQLQNQLEEEIYKAVMNVGVNVDKEELIKALRYDRNQYQKGYADRDSELVRCRNCKYWRRLFMNHEYGACRADNPIRVSDPNWFCGDGIAKDIIPDRKDGETDG